jgi:phospholipid/cholesterol/gamma-HCH transport system substrate-binding protein
MGFLGNIFGSAEFKVGAMVLSIAGLIAFMSMRVSDDPSYMGRSKKAWFLLPNASGLIKGSAIRSAGIPVGVIKEVRLQDGQARIDVTIKSDIYLTRSASVDLRANGILGDKYIEVYPGSPTDEALEDDGQILNVKKGGSLDDVMVQVSEITSSLKDVAKNLNESVTNNGTNQHIMGRIVLNIEKLTTDIAEMTDRNKDKIGDIVDQVQDITTTLDELINDDSATGFKKTWKSAMINIDKSLKNIEQITDKVNRGEGTIGKLLSDEKTAEDVSSAIEGISGLVDTANKVSTGVDFNGYYLNEVGAAQTAIGIQIQPGLDRYYYLGIITDPSGVVEKTNVKTTTGGSTTEIDEVKTFKSKTKFTALYAKNFYDFTLKGGLIENTGGVGIDYKIFRQTALASVEAYDFEKLQLRATLNFRLPYGFYVKGGYSDILDKNDARSVFAGAGIFLTNDDFKLLLSKSPF